jgi:2-oxoglutarate ferredoxin oxidoreductase subunit alpha
LYLIDAVGINQVRGLPFRVDDLVGAIRSVIDGTAVRTAVGSAGRHGGPLTVPSIQVGDDGPGSPDPDDPGGSPDEGAADEDALTLSTNGGSR